jgi:hypothetical protein
MATMTSEPRRLRPAPLLFEPAAPPPPPGHFFGLDELSDPRELLERADALHEAFYAAAERAAEYRAMAVAELNDPKRFDRWSCAQIAERLGWSHSYAQKVVEHGRRLLAAESLQLDFDVPREAHAKDSDSIPLTE